MDGVAQVGAGGETARDKATAAQPGRRFAIPPSQAGCWAENGKRGKGDAVRARPEDVREQYERPLEESQEAPPAPRPDRIRP